MKAKEIVAYLKETSPHSTKLRLQKAVGDRHADRQTDRVGVSCCSDLGFSEEEKVRLSGGKVVFSSRKIN